MNKQLADESMKEQRSAFFDEPKDLLTLASEQGVKPLDFEELMSSPTLWPEEESVDDFIATVRRWRREGKAGKGL
jgi:hypothetical protein